MKYLLFSLSLLFSFFAQAQEYDQYELIRNEQQWAKNKVQFRGDTEARGFDVVFAKIDIEIDPAVRYINGSVLLNYKITKENISQLELDLVQQLTVDSILYQGAPIIFTHSNEKIIIPFSSIFTVGTIGAIQVFYQGVPPQGSGFGSFIQDAHGADDTPVLWTLSEPYGAYEWWPCKQDLIDKVDSIDMIVRVPKGNKVAGNGLLKEVTETTDYSTYHWQHRYPIPVYLVAFATTNYVSYSDTITSPEGDIPQLNFVYPESLETAKEGTGHLVEVMELFNELFGTYPFWKEKYGHAEFGWGGGMEHTTMTFCTNFKHGLLSHELAHQWFGDDVTCGSWEDIWLNEGFATYLEGLTYEHNITDYTFDEWLIVKANKIKEKPGGSVKVDDTTNVWRIFDWRLSYSKGAMVLHMLRWTVGDDAFFQGVRNYLQDPNLHYGFGRTEDLKAHIEATSGKDLTDFFDSWYSGEGYPIYDIKWAQDDDNLLHVKIKQTQSVSADYFKMPVPFQATGNGIEESFVFQNSHDDQIFEIQLNAPITKLVFDPKHWIVANNTVTEVDDIVSLLGVSISDQLQLAPNPVSDILTLTVGDLKISAISIFDLSGKLLLRSETFFEHQQNLDVSDLKSGNYMLSVASEFGKGSIPFIKI